MPDWPPGDYATFALVLLDIVLPSGSGLDLLQRLRREVEVPVIVVSARSDTPDKVRALELGADDYVTKPFWPDELLARTHARLRRPSLHREGGLRLGDLCVDLERRSVTVREVPVHLTPAEFEVLAALVRRPGASISRATLAGRALDPDRHGSERALDVHVSRLRRKLGEGIDIRTVWGIGYRLEVVTARVEDAP